MLNQANITDINQLLQLLNLNLEGTSITPLAVTNFPLLVPHDFASKMSKNDSNDPLLRQILPQTAENLHYSDYSPDPLAEKNHCKAPGLIHKYPSKILLLVTNNCLIRCRFCFRRFNNDYIKNWPEVINYISNNTNITEAILSGGDPFSLSNQKIYDIIASLSKISHLRYLRIHTRAPIVAPKRITPKLISTITASRFKPVIVVHCNHPNEIDFKVTKSIKLLKKADITIYNQAVLLKGINDKAETLITLSEKLFANGIQPYYLHMLDKVTGSKHFEVNLDTAKQLLQQITLVLPGFLVPKLVYETPKTPFKIPILYDN